MQEWLVEILVSRTRTQQNVSAAGQVRYWTSCHVGRKGLVFLKIPLSFESLERRLENARRNQSG